LAQQGYPISNEFTELSELDGKPYTVQYFERAVFEMHSENPEPHNVLLSQLGTFQLKKKYPGGPPGGGAQPPPTAPPNPQPNPQPTNTRTGTNCDPVPDSRKSAVTNTGPVTILNAQYSGQEYVELRNTGGTAIDLGGWILRDKNDNDQQYLFAEGTQLAAGATLQVYTEPGHPYTFNSRASIWNNCGDAIELLDSTGAVVATYAYGTHLK
jgi:hypothetical protein